MEDAQYLDIMLCFAFSRLSVFNWISNVCYDFILEFPLRGVPVLENSRGEAEASFSSIRHDFNEPKG